MILLIDNYDSFTYNIYQYLLEMEYPVTVKRSREITVEEISRLNPTHIIISPGPGRPEGAGISMEVIRRFKGQVPILGVCLGHQSIGAVFGGRIVRAAHLFHGKSSLIEHDGKGCFFGIESPFTAIRYHSLAIEKKSLPPQLEITAVSDDGEIMGVRHREYPIEGIQFHPESIGTEEGRRLLRNFIESEHLKPAVPNALQRILGGETLSETRAARVMEDITSGRVSPAQIAALLTALRMRGETVEELTGFARVMRRKASGVRKPLNRKVVDTCGTGGDACGTFNISTLSALVAAGCDVAVAKHGNRSVTSKCGSADVLEGLGVNLDLGPDGLGRLLEQIGIAFLFAPRLHESMKHAVPVRKQLGFRTVFNILGPLSNPAGADFQLLGVYSDHLREKIARVLVNLGVARAMVVHGSDGLDEITLTGKTNVSEVRDGWIRNYALDPRDYGMSYCTLEDLRGGDAGTNAEIVRSILKGEKGPRRDIVILNAAAAIYIAAPKLEFSEAVQLARESIDKGWARDRLDFLVRFSNEPQLEKRSA